MSNAQIAGQAFTGWPEGRVGASFAGQISWRRKVSSALLAADVTAVAAASFLSLLFAGQERFAVPVIGEISLLAATLVLAICWVGALSGTRTRSLRAVGAGLDQYRSVILVSLRLFGAVAVVGYLIGASASRSIFGVLLPAGLVLLLGGRWTVRRLVNNARSRGNALTPTLLVGTGPQIGQLLGDLGRRPDVGYRAAGICVQGGDLAPITANEPVERLSIDQLEAAAASGRYGAVMVGEGVDGRSVRSLAWALESSPVEMILIPRLADVAGPRLQISDVEGLSMVHVDLPRFSGWRLGLKRAFDLAFASVALVLLAPVFAVVAILIKLDDGGPVFFRQERIGLNGQPFMIHKFRTMCIDAEQQIAALIESAGGTALLFKLEDDPRITRLGKILRKYSIDELPQFWSVLRGGMSVVGPRPQVAREVAEYTDMHHRRLLTKPGITGLWQVNGRSALSMEESIRLDLRYVENWSLLGDIVIILKTVRVVLEPSGAF